jgi:hypothetical protein
MDLDEWVVSSEDIQIGNSIGGGTNATVYAAKYRGVDVAAKVFRQLACDSERFRQETNAIIHTAESLKPMRCVISDSVRALEVIKCGTGNGKTCATNTMPMKSESI